MGGIGTAITGVSDIASLASGGKGGGGSSGQPFQSMGGITPEQMALAQYDYGGSLLQSQGQFPQGAAMSTMATQGAEGANWGKALNEAKMSDVNQQAQYGAQQVSQQFANQNTSELANLATSLSKAAGSGLGTQPQTTGQ